MKNKIVLVVGGTRGIGLATAEKLSAEGTTVFLTGEDRAEVDAAVLTVGARAHGIVAYTARPNGMAEVVEILERRALASTD